MKPVRVAFGGKVKSSLYEHTLDCKIEGHPLKPTLDKLTEEEKTLRTDIDELKKKIRAKKVKTTPQYEARLVRMRSAGIMKERVLNVVRAKMYAMRQRMLREILAAADVVRIFISISA